MLAWALTVALSASPEAQAERTVRAWVNLVPAAMGFTWTPPRPGVGLGANVDLSKYVGISFEAAPVDVLNTPLNLPRNWMPTTQGAATVREIGHELLGSLGGA